jgi:hypothetical protein
MNGQAVDAGGAEPAIQVAGTGYRGAAMRLSKRGHWWIETAVLFVVFTAGFGAIYQFLIERSETWSQSLVRGAVFAVGMILLLSVSVRRQRREGSGRRPVRRRRP